jgi:VWFA-related protein
MLVMIETGPAVYLIHDQHLAAAFALVQGLDAADQVALVSYSDKPRTVLGFTTNKSEFLGALGSLQYTMGMGNLNLFDSLASVVKVLAHTEGKAAVVLLTTGIDASPPSEWERLVEQLRGTDVEIYPVALGGVLRGDQNPKKKGRRHAAPSDVGSALQPNSLGTLTGFARADRALNVLAQITGGRAYFPQADKDFAPMYREIAAALRHQYVLGIAPAHDGKFHALTVQVLPSGAGSAKKTSKKSTYRIFARQGYVAP